MKSIKNLMFIAVCVQIIAVSCTNKNKETSKYEDEMDQEEKEKSVEELEK